MKKSFRVVLLILVLLLVFSFAYESAESAHHDCEGEDCPICAILFVLSSFALAGLILFVAYAIFYKNEKKNVAESRETFFAITPVSLKIKLSD